jgi:hypothetical protein
MCTTSQEMQAGLVAKLSGHPFPQKIQRTDGKDNAHLDQPMRSKGHGTYQVPQKLRACMPAVRCALKAVASGCPAAARTVFTPDIHMS